MVDNALGTVDVVLFCACSEGICHCAHAGVEHVPLWGFMYVLTMYVQLYSVYFVYISSFILLAAAVVGPLFCLQLQWLVHCSVYSCSGWSTVLFAAAVVGPLFCLQLQWLVHCSVCSCSGWSTVLLAAAVGWSTVLFTAAVVECSAMLSASGDVVILLQSRVPSSLSFVYVDAEVEGEEPPPSQCHLPAG